MKRYLINENSRSLLKLAYEISADKKLFISAELYKLNSDLPNTVKESLINDPISSDNVFQNYIKSSNELIAREEIPLSESSKYISGLNKLLSSSTEDKFTIIITSKETNKKYYFEISYSDLLILKAFFEQFITNYDILLQNLSTKSPSEEPARFSTNYIDELLKISSVNNFQIYTLSSFITSELNLIHDNLEIISKEDNNISINLPYINFIQNLLYDLRYLSSSITDNKQDKDFYLSKCIIFYKLLNSFINEYTSPNNNNEKKYTLIETFYYLRIIEFLIFIYYLLYLDKISYLYLVHTPSQFNDLLVKVLNHCLTFLQKRSSGKYTISFKYYYVNKDSYSNISIDRNIIKKYSYLINIDKSEFISTILSSLNREDNKSNNIKFAPISSPYILDITNFIDKESNNKFLNYKTIKSNESIFKDHKIISKPYFDILRLQYSPKDSKSLLSIYVNEIEDLSKLSAQFYSVIQEIFKEMLSKDHLVIPNTLHIMNEFILPYFNHLDISSETMLLILYQIIIPFLYDYFDMYQFKDYFLPVNF